MGMNWFKYNNHLDEFECWGVYLLYVCTMTEMQPFAHARLDAFISSRSSAIVSLSINGLPDSLGRVLIT